MRKAKEMLEEFMQYVKATPQHAARFPFSRSTRCHRNDCDDDSVGETAGLNPDELRALVGIRARKWTLTSTTLH